MKFRNVYLALILIWKRKSKMIAAEVKWSLKMVFVKEYGFEERALLEFGAATIDMSKELLKSL